MKTILIVLGIILFIGFVALVGLGAFQLGRFYQRPLAEPLQLTQVKSTATPTATATAAPLPEATTEPAAAPQPEKKGNCGEEGSLLILFTGADFSAGTWPEGADSVRTIKVDFDEPAIISVAFPRDLWVQTRILADQNISATRLGQVYEYKKDTTTGSDKHRVSAASVAVAQTLLDNFQLPSDQYFTLQLQFVASMIDTIGGVPINNPYAFTTEYGITFPAGEQVLNGALSAEFVRAYTPGGDPARRERQDLYVTALHQKVLNPEILLKVPDLYKQFDQVIVTDLTPEQINALACMANLVPPSQVKYYEIDETMTTPREIGEPVPVLDPNVPAITNQLKIWLGY